MPPPERPARRGKPTRRTERPVDAPEVVGAKIVRRELRLDDVNLDPSTRRIIEARLANVLPGVVIPPGRDVPPRTAGPEDLQRLVAAAAIVAAGLDPARTLDPPPPVLWERNGSRLLVVVSGVRASIIDGLIEITVPTRTDDTGDAEVSVSFVIGSPDRPAGGVAVTEDRPRGPALIVENWHEPLIAFAWQIFTGASAALTRSAATDRAGRPLLVAGVVASSDGLAVQPMARHAFDRFGLRR